MTTNRNLTGMQKLLFCLLMEQLQGDYIRIRKYLTHQICKWVITSIDENDIEYEKTTVNAEDDKYYYVNFTIKSGYEAIIPLSKDWAIANYVKNNMKALTKKEKTNDLQQKELHKQSA